MALVQTNKQILITTSMKNKHGLLNLPSGISVSYGNDDAASKSVTGNSEASLAIKIEFKL